jgi:hypothetical protein
MIAMVPRIFVGAVFDIIAYRYEVKKKRLNKQIKVKKN